MPTRTKTWLAAKTTKVKTHIAHSEFLSIIISFFLLSFFLVQFTIRHQYDK
jgi:hypothetical protein